MGVVYFYKALNTRSQCTDILIIGRQKIDLKILYYTFNYHTIYLAEGFRHWLDAPLKSWMVEAALTTRSRWLFLCRLPSNDSRRQMVARRRTRKPLSTFVYRPYLPFHTLNILTVST